MKNTIESLRHEHESQGIAGDGSTPGSTPVKSVRPSQEEIERLRAEKASKKALSMAMKASAEQELAEKTIAENFDKAKAALDQLLSETGIDRIVFVDDTHSVDISDESQLAKVLIYCADLDNVASPPHDLLADVNFDQPQQVWEDQVKAKWQNLSLSQKRQILTITQDRAAEYEEQQQDANLGLQNLFAGREFVPMSLGAWNEVKDRYIGEVNEKSTLFLFDRAFDKELSTAPPELASRIEDAGILLMKEVCDRTKDCPQRALCGLITYTIQLADEEQQWGTLKQKHDIDVKRCIPIPKACLAPDGEEISGFVRRVKFTILVEYYERLKSEVLRIGGDAWAYARERVEDFSIHNLEFLLFEKARREGLWEVDALFRMFGIYHGKEAKRLAKLSPEIKELLQKLRPLSQIPVSTPAVMRGKDRLKGAQQSEIYDEAEHINGCHLPLECGDIFETKDGKHWLLLEQPCNLMVRSHRDLEKDGERSALPESVSLVEIVEERPDTDINNIVELPYYTGENFRSVWADMRQQRSVAVWILDLCVLNREGEAAMSAESSSVVEVLPAWQARQKKLRIKVEEIVSEYRRVEQILGAIELEEEMRSRLLQGLIPMAAHSGPFDGEISTNNEWEMKYGIRRLRRLLRPWADVALISLHNYGARPGLDMDLGK